LGQEVGAAIGSHTNGEAGLKCLKKQQTENQLSPNKAFFMRKSVELICG